jgi:hypothetical protein
MDFTSFVVLVVDPLHPMSKERMSCAILEREPCTPDTLIRAEVTTQGIGIEVFHGEKVYKSSDI